MTKNPGADDSQRIRRRDIDTLYLDPENPRIFVASGAKQKELLRELYRIEALDELAASFANNGYFTEEPVVVVPAAGDDNRFIVVEGNRRIATIKILLSPKLRREFDADWPVLTEARRLELKSIPTVSYPDRASVVPYLGFRHITGNKKWEPLAKARYVAKLVESGRPIDTIEQSVGDTARTVKKLYQSWVVLQQIRLDLEIETRPAIEESFSLLEVVLGQQPLKEFLGVSRSLPSRPTKEVVPGSHLEKLREVVSWVFGDPVARQVRIISDSRQIPQRLAPIVKDSEALEHLRRTRDLEGAYEFSGGEREMVLRWLTRVRRDVQRINGVLPAHRDDEKVVGEVRGLRPLLEQLLSVVEA